MSLLLLLSLTAHARPLDGHWVQKCRNAYQREEFFSENEAVYIETNFLDRACTIPAIELRSHGVIELGRPVALPSRASAIDFRFTRVEAVLRHERYLQFFREKKVCGFSDWELGAARDVTGLDCGVFRAPSAGLPRYGVYLLSGEELYFGRLTPERDASTPERRPQELDPAPYRKRSSLPPPQIPIRFHGGPDSKRQYSPRAAFQHGRLALPRWSLPDLFRGRGA